MRLAVIVLISLISYELTPCECRSKAKFVTTLIDAKWHQTPIVQEISEFLAEENANLFWSFIDDISDDEKPFSTLENEKIKYDVAIAKAASYLSPTQVSLLKLSLSLRIYSPRIEMYSQMASQRQLPCPITVDVSGKIVCSIDEVVVNIENAIITEETEVFNVDHYYPGSQNRSLIVILYAEIGVPRFKDYHSLLKKYAIDGKISYVLRHRVENQIQRKVRLSGYGVELQMKSTEYKAQDDSIVDDKKKDSNEDQSASSEDETEIEGFNFNVLKTRHHDLTAHFDKFRYHLENSMDDLKPLKVWQFQELSLQAAEKIMAEQNENALDTFINIAQNFPKQTRSLVNIRVKPERRKEIQKNQDRILMMLNLPPSDTALFINGMFFDVDVIDIFSILDTVRQEIRVMEGLREIGVNNRNTISSVLSLDLSHSGNDDYAIDIRDSAVIWINDIENDSKYRRWSPMLMDLLKPTFPGMLRSIRKNLYNLVIMCDAAHRDCWPLLKLAESFIIHSAPVRVGLVFSTPPLPISGLESASAALLNAFNYVSEEKDRYEGLSFITEVYATIKGQRDVEVEDVKKRLQILSYGADINDILGNDSDYNTGRQLASDFISRSGLRSMPQALVNGVPLPEKSLNKEDFEEAMLTEIMSQTPTFQKAVYRGEFTEGDDTLDYIMNRPNVMPRLNNRVLNQEKSIQLDLLQPSIADISQRMKYTTRKKAGAISLLTFWVVGDFEENAGRQLLENALDYLDTNGNSRIGVVINRSSKEASQNRVNKFVLAASRANLDVAKILKHAQAIKKGEKNADDFGLKDVDWDEIDRIIEIDEAFCKQSLSFAAGNLGIVVNGRVIGPLDEDEDFLVADFTLLERHALRTSVDKIYAVLKDKLDEMEGCKSNVLMKAVSLLANKPQSKSRFKLNELSEEYSVIKLAVKNEDEPVLEVAVVVDPVSRGAQKIGPIVKVLRQTLNAEVKIYLNCQERISDMPLKSYYRYVLEPELRFTADGDLENGPVANFTEVSPASLLTQNMHVPENWLVESVATPYDLDNIRLQDVDSFVHSEFELEYLLLEGHCFDTTFGTPPRGLQITLGTETNPVIVDTIVMANLGYFQLKANPGAWILRLRQGRSSDIYEIASHEGADKPNASGDIKILISSFQSRVMKLKVTKKPDKIHEELLADENDGNNGIWSSIANTFSGSGGNKDELVEDEPINIFSVASGHLYERFLRIMMVSVLKHTKSPVKFWFLKNYLSPSFKDFLPKMAKKYGFKYELVQYKWPRWLHQQNEKQRIIWGYKILFLDVLFPLDVRKIIFVDADQVVRADMKELVNYDLQGAPYGYTPFCDSRKEMDGFRFWKQGYWQTHLQGRSYHISALYVVDLKRFRKIAAGDRLRGQYQALSQDPNSLSNLDQDLPNNMIHQVSIKSLPQEWLWCETWCDNSSKEKAKTIDLCNNPLTKEAKLTAAMRIIDEWKDYDAEIKRLQLGIDDVADEEEIVPSDDKDENKTPLHDKHTEL